MWERDSSQTITNHNRGKMSLDIRGSNEAGVHYSRVTALLSAYLVIHLSFIEYNLKLPCVWPPLQDTDIVVAYTLVTCPFLQHAQ